METTFPKVPVIGLQRRQVQITQTMIAAVLVCDCGSTAPVLIPNHDRAGVCLACKTKYVLSALDFQNQGGLITMDTQVAKWNGPMSASRELDVSAD